MPAPTEKTIRHLVGDRSFARGERYYRNGHIHAPRRQGKLLRARCYGSDGNDYRLEVRLSGSKIVGGRCSCPVGEGGLCKHVAALLLNWRDKPEDFRDAPDVEKLLADRSKSELIDVIRILLDAEPDLEEILDSMLTTGAHGKPELGQFVQKTVAEALRRLRESGAPSLAAAAIRGQLSQARRRQAAGKTADAIMILRGILAAVLEAYDFDADAGGEVARAAADAASDLTRHFSELSGDDELRSEVFSELLALLWFDVCHAGAGVAEAVPDAIARHASAEEKRSILVSMREFVPSRRGSVSDAWQRECWGALIADIVGEAMSAEEYRALCHEFGLNAGLPQVRAEPGKRHVAEPRKKRKRNPSR